MLLLPSSHVFLLEGTACRAPPRLLGCWHVSPREISDAVRLLAHFMASEELQAANGCRMSPCVAVSQPCVLGRGACLAIPVADPVLHAPPQD